MSVSYAICFALMSIGAACGAIGAASMPWLATVLGWAALAFAIVSVAYAAGRPQFFLKRSDGSRPIWSWIIFCPYFALARLSFWIYRVTHHRDPAFAEVQPGLWFGRLLAGREGRAQGDRWLSVLDLAAEFPRAKIAAKHYRSLPMLDGAVASPAQLREGVDWIDKQLKEGPVLVHCALGHGRTGSIVVAWLLAHGQAADVRAGIARLRALRPGFGLSAAQRAGLKRIARV